MGALSFVFPLGSFGLSFVLSLVLPFGYNFICKFYLVRSWPSRDRPGRRAKESLQRAAIARTADRKN